MILFFRTFAVLFFFSLSGLGALFFLASTPLWTEESKEKNERLMASLSINQKLQGMVFTEIRGEEVYCNRQTVINALQKSLSVEGREKLTRIPSTEEFLSLQDLRNLGYKADFSLPTLTVQIAVPPRDLLRTEHALQRRGRPLQEDVHLTPNPFSAYLNIRATQGYTESKVASTQTGLNPLQGQLDGAAYFQGFVLESIYNYQDRREFPLRRQTARVVFDRPEDMLRITVGDLSLQPIGFQSALSNGGVSIAKNYQLQPYFVSTPISESEVFLRTPSKVEIWSNGRWLRTLHLPAGTHKFSDFPARVGSNEVQLRVTDDTGMTEILDVPFLYEPKLLAQGLQEFIYQLGWMSEQQRSDLRYDTGKPLLSAMHRKGFSNVLTLGAYAQAADKQGLLGSEGVWATKIGALSFDLAGSWVDHVGSDFAVRMSYRNYRSPQEERSRGMNLNCRATYRGRRFAQIGTLNPDQSTKLDIAASANRRLSETFSVGFGGDWQWLRAEERNPYRLYAFSNTNHNKGWDIGTTLEYRSHRDGRYERSILLTAKWRFKERKDALSLTRDTGENTTSVSWRHSSPRSVQAFNADANYDRSVDTQTMSANLGYIGYRGQSDFSYRYSNPRGDLEGTHEGKVTLSTSLVYVDGHFGLTRPVGNNSFALVIPNQFFKKKTIIVNPIRDDYAGKSDFFGPAVVHDLRSYQIRKLYIEALDVPVGYDLGQNYFNALPHYRSGIAIHVGVDSTVYLGATLLDTNGQPLSLQAGHIVDLEHPERSPVLFFTNRTGKFRVLGIVPGKMRIEMLSQEWKSVEVSVPSDTVGFYDMGTVQVTSKENLQ